MNILFIVYWFRLWWQHSEYRTKAKDAIVKGAIKVKNMSFSSTNSGRFSNLSIKALNILGASANDTDANSGLPADFYESTRLALYGEKKWIRILDVNGEIYLYNAETGVRKKAEDEKTKSGRCADGLVEDDYQSRARRALNSVDGNGWVQLMDEDGEVFWFNGRTGQETYANPNMGGGGGGGFSTVQKGEEEKVAPEEQRKKRRKSCRTPLVVEDHIEKNKKKKKKNVKKNDIPAKRLNEGAFEMTNILAIETDEVGVARTTEQMEEGSVGAPPLQQISRSSGGSGGGGGGRGKTQWKKIRKSLRMPAKRLTKEEEQDRQRRRVTSDMSARLQHLIAASKRG
jgi:hypothetical protein